MSVTKRRTDSLVEQWLWEDVALVYDAMQANPERGIPMEDVLAAIRKHHTERSR